MIGLDIGTSASKAVAYDRQGRSHAASSSEYGLVSRLPGRAEQDPAVIVSAAKEALRTCAARAGKAGARIASVVVSSAMHGLAALGATGDAITPLITWGDNRATAQVRALRSSGDASRIYERSGAPVHPMTPLAKLLWFRANEPDVFARAARWVSAKELLFHDLFGETVVDPSVAAATGLTDLPALDWDDELLSLVEVNRAQLSPVVPAHHVVGRLEGEVARSLSLPEGIPLLAGASDGVLANVGAGAVRTGMAACNIGTSGAVRITVARPLLDVQGRLFCYPLEPGTWVVGGPINNGGVALAWLRDRVLSESSDATKTKDALPYSRLDEMAEGAGPGADGVIFMPYLLGERAPQWNPQARAGFLGLSFHHGREHLVRAVMEGVVLQLDMVLALVEDLAGGADEIRASGGFAHSALWRQIMTDVFGREVVFPEDLQSVCLGAAIIGMRELGWIDSLSEAEEKVRVGERLAPDEPSRDLYGALRDDFRQLAALLAPPWGATEMDGS